MGDGAPAGSSQVDRTSTPDLEAALAALATEPTGPSTVDTAIATAELEAVGVAEPTEQMHGRTERAAGGSGLLPALRQPPPPRSAGRSSSLPGTVPAVPSVHRRKKGYTAESALDSNDRCALCLEPGHTKEQCRFYVEKKSWRMDVSSFRGYQVERGSDLQSSALRHMQRQQDRSRHVCYLCGQMGHWKRDCPQNPDRKITPAADDATKVWACTEEHQRLAEIRTDANRFNKPLPANVDITIPGISKAWEWFQRVDEDQSGRLDLDEVSELAHQLGFKWSKAELAQNYEKMTTVNGYYTKSSSSVDTTAHRAPSNGKGASFHDFAAWWARYTAVTRRSMRRTVKELFNKLDSERCGVLDHEKFKQLVGRINKRPDLPRLANSTSEPLDVDIEWEEIPKIRFSPHHTKFAGMVGITFDAFESWWMEQVGINEPDLPVLPEYLVSQAGQKVAAFQYLEAKRQNVPVWHIKMKVWDTMQQKLRLMVRMQLQWGSLWDIYETRSQSVFEADDIPRFIRDPDSLTSALWDLVSVLLLLYVTASVPARACFNEEAELWSASFWFEAWIDFFFILDILVNFRTAYWDSNGFREKDSKKIAEHYLEHWFLLDLVSCIPVGYVQYFISTDEQGSTEFRAVKAIRLLKMTKMLRLSRVKRILARHGSATNYHQYFSIASTVFTIAVTVHLMTCIFYLLGDGYEKIRSTGSDDVIVIVDGWVAREKDWWTNSSKLTPGGHRTPDLSIGLTERYTTSMYYVLNSLSRGFTTGEKMFAVLADFVRDIIVGLVASLMTTITMSMSVDDNQVAMKMQRLKKWMRERHLPKGFQQNAIEYFNEVWTNQGLKVEELVKECPPAMATSMTHLLYGRAISNIPPFRGLSTEVIGAICMRCRSLLAVKDQTVIRQGEPGVEMYVVMSGELEVTVRDETTDTDTQAQSQKRLGFLSAGAFFGEAPVLAPRHDTSLLLRSRTVTAVTDSELCYLTRDAIAELCVDFPELRARINRFQTSGAVLNNSRLKRMNMTREDLNSSAKSYKAKLQTTERIRRELNLDDSAYVPAALLPSENPFLMARAQMRIRRGSVTVLQRMRAKHAVATSQHASRATYEPPTRDVQANDGRMETNSDTETEIGSSVDSGWMAVRQMLQEHRESMSQSMAELRQEQQQLMAEQRESIAEQRLELTAMGKKLDALNETVTLRTGSL